MRNIFVILFNTPFFVVGQDNSAQQLDQQLSLDMDLYFLQMLSSNIIIQTMYQDKMLQILPNTNITFKNLDIHRQRDESTFYIVKEGQLTQVETDVQNGTCVEIQNKVDVIV